ncbi:MAG: Gfo/Idh/MocA family oxidoreductase [Halanaerobiaceae bacterium]|jgi:predicted dehydrogenase|nr:Gfo/Idh/MocA family oxidoreductase [Halanaerobiaceae bacterium]
MKRLKVGIIGCGNISGVHADAVRKSQRAELAAVVDIVEERAKRAGEKYQCPYFTDYRDISNIGLDLVHICTPHYLHHSMAIDMMEAGLDVLVEKPLAVNTAEAEKMLRTAEKTGRKLGIVYQNRFNENALAVRRIIDEKRYGRILGIKGVLTWFRDKAYYQQDQWRGFYKTEGGGVLISQAIHTLDLLCWFAGDVEAVKGSIDTRVLEEIIEVEDTAEAVIYFKNGVTGLFYASNCFASNSPVEIDIVFEKASLKLIGDRFLLKDYGEEIYRQDGKKTEYKSYWGQGHERLIEGFYSDILEGREGNIIRAEEGLKTLQVIEGIYSSSRSGEKYFLAELH